MSEDRDTATASGRGEAPPGDRVVPPPAGKVAPPGGRVVPPTDRVVPPTDRVVAPPGARFASPARELVIREAVGEELVAGCALLGRALGFAERDALPPWLVQTAAGCGGIALGAFAGARLAGFSFALPAAGGELFSCGLAVAPAFRDRGIGRALKLAQRDRALAQGCSRLRWTADPLAAPALSLYLSGLGARLVAYEPELYAAVRPAAVAPDDVVIEWPLSRTPAPRDVPAARIEIPYDHRSLEREALRRARLDVRERMIAALDAGAVGTGVAVERAARRAWVLFSVMTAVSITVDVDGVAGLPDGGAGFGQRLSRLSEREYGLGPGLERILGVLDEFGARATFYVPGVTALRHPDEIGALGRSRHELGHHGHTHRSPHTLSDAEQRQEIALGLEALEAVAGCVAAGYRAPGWELTGATLDALAGFDWDSSLMGSDRPYMVGGLVELPVHWALDDAPHFEHTTDPAGLLAVWRAELAAAAREARHTSVTCHPEILGRAHRVDVLRRTLACALELGLEVVAHGDVARAFA